MIAYTVAQAATRVCTTVDTIEQWITMGVLLAVRNPIDGHRYVEEEHLLDVDRDLWRDGHAPIARPEPLPLPALRQWLWDRGLPVTDRALEDWVYGQRVIRATIPGRRGRGGAARFDPLEALAVAINPRYAPRKQPLAW